MSAASVAHSTITDRMNDQAAQCALSGDDLQSLTAEVNRLRAHHGLSALATDGSLSESAFDHARDIAAMKRLSHEGNDGATFDVRAERRGYDAFPLAENIAYNQRDVPHVVRAWRDSPPHLKALLVDGADDVGFGRACSDDAEPYWVMVVGG